MSGIGVSKQCQNFHNFYKRIYTIIFNNHSVIKKGNSHENKS